MRMAGFSAVAWAVLFCIAIGMSADAGGFGGRFSSRTVGRAPTGGGLSQKRIAALGDSNTEGYGLAGNETWAARLDDPNHLGATYAIDNFGVGGYTCTQVDNKWTTTVAPLKYGVVVLMCGTNDIRTYGDSAATVYARITALVAKIKTTGARVVLMTVLPAGTSEGYTSAIEAQRVALNASILGTSGVTTVNLEPLLAGGGSPPALAQTLDGLHLSPAGAIIVANALTPILTVP